MVWASIPHMGSSQKRGSLLGFFFKAAVLCWRPHKRDPNLENYPYMYFRPFGSQLEILGTTVYDRNSSITHN